MRIADDGEVLLSGGQVFRGYWDTERRRRPSPRWTAAGSPPATSGALDEDGYLTITGRKKEILITAGGKNVAPAPLEDWLRAHPLVGQCMVVGDNRPYVAALITLDPDGLTALAPDAQASRTCRPGTWSADEELRAALQRAVDEANQLVSRAESIRRFTVLPVDFTEEGGHLTPVDEAEAGRDRCGTSRRRSRSCTGGRRTIPAGWLGRRGGRAGTRWSRCRGRRGTEPDDASAAAENAEKAA